MNNLPTSIKCTMCPKGIMYKSKLGEFHQYYKCNNNNCKDVTGLPLAQYSEVDSGTDFGSGAYHSKRDDNE